MAEPQMRNLSAVTDHIFVSLNYNFRKLRGKTKNYYNSLVVRPLKKTHQIMLSFSHHGATITMVEPRHRATAESHVALESLV